MPNSYRQASYMLSAHIVKQFPPDQGREVAFVGRSNAGKSSALNAITDQKNLARTSKIPGRTQQINFFQLTDQQRLADLPGYGFAKVPPAVQQHWQTLFVRYLGSRKSLKGLIWVMDIRHPLTEVDQTWLMQHVPLHLPLHILLTKADKLSRSAGLNTLNQIEQRLQTEHTQRLVSLQVFSALKRQGIEEVYHYLDQWLNDVG